MSTPRLRLGQLLVDARLITQDDLDEILALQAREGGRLGGLLVQRGLIDETQLTQILSHQLAIPWVSLLHIDFSRQLLNLVPREVVERFCLVPIYVRHVRGQGDTLYVAMDDPGNEEALAACAAYSGLPVRSMIAPPTDIRSAIRVYYGGGRASEAITVVDAAPAPAPPEPPAPAVVEPPRTRSERPRSRRSIPAPSPATPEAAMPVVGEVAVAVARAEAPPPAPEPPIQEEPVAAASPAAPPVKRSGPRMVALTLLDGTTITLPARHRSSRSQPPPEGGADHDNQLTARDLVAALRAVSHGADASEILGETRWETLFAALLSLLLKKQLIADWEFVEELKST